MEIPGFIDATAILRCGVYALGHKGVIVYIGKSKTMLGRIYTHRAQWGRKSVPWLNVKGMVFDAVHICPCHPDKVDQLEYDMIDLYKPKFNTLLKHTGRQSAEFTLKINGHDITFNRKTQSPPTHPKLERRI
jgi:excinuclease UvrABC nuclease subunit